MIELDDIYKTYVLGGEEVHALDGVSLTIEDHEFVAIIGASGSGKSTLMNIVGCLDNADGGQYYIDGQNIMDMTEREIGIMRNRKIGFIFQQFNLIPKLDAYENVELPLIYQGVAAKERRERVQESLEKVGLAERMHHRPNQLSGGQQQRVAVARALVTRPTLILADEPTGSVKLVQHYPKIIPVTFPALSTFISSMADRQRVRFSSRDKVSYIALKSAVKYFLTAAKSGGASCAGSGSCPSAAVYIS